MEEIDYKHEPRGKGDTLLAIVPMPASPDLAEGAINRLKISVRYLKNGMGHMGRGYYLQVCGAAYDGISERHTMFQDPSSFVLIEETKRFSVKAFDEAVSSVAGKMNSEIQKLVASARQYYEGKGKDAEDSYSPEGMKV